MTLNLSDHVIAGEIMPFGAGHPLLATHLPLGHIECEIAGLVPGYSIRRVDLAAGTPQRTALVQIEPAAIPSHPEQVSS